MKLKVNTTKNEVFLGRVLVTLSEEELFALLGGKTIGNDLHVSTDPDSRYQLEILKQTKTDVRTGEETG